MTVTIQHHFESLPDPRVLRTRKHPLMSVLILALLAVTPEGTRRLVHAGLLFCEDATMNHSHRFPFQKMHVYQAAKEFAKALHLAKIRDPKLRDQATRAAKSALLQLSEGLA